VDPPADDRDPAEQGDVSVIHNPQVLLPLPLIYETTDTMVGTQERTT
jgi:hypothetical protein